MEDWWFMHVIQFHRLVESVPRIIEAVVAQHFTEAEYFQLRDVNRFALIKLAVLKPLQMLFTGKDLYFEL